MAKKLEARVREGSRLPTVTAFGGREYVRKQWRPVPDEQADSAEGNPYLEVREVDETGGGDVAKRKAAVTVDEPTPPADDAADEPTPPTGKSAEPEKESEGKEKASRRTTKRGQS